MTKEEVVEIESYCKSSGTPIKRRLKEMGVAPWQFYYAKRKISDEAEEYTGAFIQVGAGAPSRQQVALQLPNGVTIRIEGSMSNVDMASLIEAAAHV